MKTASQRVGSWMGRNIWSITHNRSMRCLFRSNQQLQPQNDQKCCFYAFDQSLVLFWFSTSISIWQFGLLAFELSALNLSKSAIDASNQGEKNWSASMTRMLFSDIVEMYTFILIFLLKTPHRIRFTGNSAAWDITPISKETSEKIGD